MDASIILGPDADILQIRIGGSPGGQDLRNVAPVHALKMDRTVNRECCRLRKAVPGPGQRGDRPE